MVGKRTSLRLQSVSILRWLEKGGFDTERNPQALGLSHTPFLPGGTNTPEETGRQVKSRSAAFFAKVIGCKWSVLNQHFLGQMTNLFT